MSVSLQSLMIDGPVERPKRSRLRRVTTVTMIVIGVAAVLALLLAAAGVKLLLGGLLARF